jgi:hypothetical protein
MLELMRGHCNSIEEAVPQDHRKSLCQRRLRGRRFVTQELDNEEKIQTEEGCRSAGWAVTALCSTFRADYRLATTHVQMSNRGIAIRGHCTFRRRDESVRRLPNFRGSVTRGIRDERASAMFCHPFGVRGDIWGVFRWRRGLATGYFLPAPPG